MSRLEIGFTLNFQVYLLIRKIIMARVFDCQFFIFICLSSVSVQCFASDEGLLIMYYYQGMKFNSLKNMANIFELT